MPFYTFIMEYAGGTYISQIKASSPKSACVKGAQSIDLSEVSAVGPKGKASLIKQLKEEPPAALVGLANAWCTSALVRGELVLINLVQTEQSKNDRNRTVNGSSPA